MVRWILILLVYGGVARAEPATSVWADSGTSCAALKSGKVACWGQVFLENGVTSATPTVIPGVTDAIQIDSLADVCVLGRNGSLRCWRTGTLRSKPMGKIEPITLVTSPVTDIVELALGSGSTCVRIKDGTVSCWGRNEIGQGGNGRKTDSLAAVPVKGLTGALQLTGSAYASCAVRADHTAVCWGYNHVGELGDGTKTTRFVPTGIPKLADVSQIALGDSHGCALTKGTVRCWGNNDYGQLGDGTTKSHLAHAPVTGVTDAVALVAGAGGTCAIDKAAKLWCWGAIAPGLKTRNRPAVLLENVAQVSIGGDHGCALMKDGGVQCWGGNGSGQLGDGSTDLHRDKPGPVKL